MLLLVLWELTLVCLKIHQNVDSEALALALLNAGLENGVLSVLVPQISQNLFLVVHQICVFKTVYSFGQSTRKTHFSKELHIKFTLREFTLMSEV